MNLITYVLHINLRGITSYIIAAMLLFGLATHYHEYIVTMLVTAFDQCLNGFQNVQIPDLKYNSYENRETKGSSINTHVDIS